MTDRQLREYIPFMAIENGAILSKRGDVTFGWELVLPTAFTVNEAGYDSIIYSFLQAYRLLPVYCVVHKQDVYRFDTFRAGHKEHFLPDSYERHFDGRKYLNGHSYIYLTFSTKSNIERNNSGSGFFGISGLSNISPERLRECAVYASQFEAVLKNNNLIRVKPMETGDFLRMGDHGQDEGVVADFLKFFHDDGPDYNIGFEDSYVSYGDERLKVWYVEDSDAYPGMVTSTKLVNSMSRGAVRVFLSGGSPIGYNLRIPHVVNRYILTLPMSAVENDLDSKRRTMQAFSLYSAKDGVNAQELGDYLLASAKESATTVKCHMNVMAWGTQNQIADIRNSIVTAFHSKLNVAVVEEERIVPVYHYAAIPGAAAELGFDSYLTSEITAFCCHGLWDGYDFGMRDGVVHVCDRETLTPIVVDLQSNARKRGFINNMNMLVVGPSGSGKSFTMNSLVQDFYENNEHILIVDVGNSYQGYCQVVAEESGGKDGVYNTYDPEHRFGFNPFKGFRHWNERDEDGEQVTSGYNFILSLLKTVYKPKEGWNNESSSILKFLVNLFLSWWDNGVPDSLLEDLLDAHMNERRRRAEKNHRKLDEEKAKVGFKNPIGDIFREGRQGTDPIFDDFFRFVTKIVLPLMKDENFKMGDILITSQLLDVDRMAAAMDKYKSDGMYDFLLNAKEEADLFRSRLTVYEVDEIKDNEDLFPIWVLCIMYSFEAKMRSLPGQKVMIIEEAWKAIATETMATFIEWMWRTARKFSTSAVVVTQDIHDLTGSPIIKDAIIQNTDIRILLDQRQNINSFDSVSDILGLDEMKRNLILSVGTSLQPGHNHYKEGYFQIGQNYSNVFALEVSVEQALAFESDIVLKEPVLRRAKECGSIIQAIREAAEKIKRGIS